MSCHSRVLTGFSHLVSAPVFAFPVFLVLGILEGASPVHVAVAVVFACVLPLAGVLAIARREGLDYDIPDRKARTRPFLVALASYAVGLFLLVLSRAPLLVSGLMLAYAVNTSVIFLITFYWRISVHAAGITGPLTFLIFRVGTLSGLLYLIVVPVGLVRYRLEKHTVSEIAGGAVISAALTWMDILLLVPLIPFRPA